MTARHRHKDDCDRHEAASIVLKRDYSRDVSLVDLHDRRYAGGTAYDLIEKRAAYRGIVSLVAYVVVHTDMRVVEVDSRDTDGTWATETFDEESFVDGRALMLSEIYAGTSLESEETR